MNLEKHMPIIGIILGGILFGIIYGFKILDPTFIGWTMSGDAAQHLLGWHFFRFEPWSWPLGRIQSFPYPEGTSVIYTDSIPLIAIPLKLFSDFLPPIFQYHGLWLLLCYCLQGYFAVLLLKKITQHNVIILISVFFFLLSPVMVQRSGGHESLSAHWLILAAFYLYFEKNTQPTPIKWLILIITASWVHFYLLLMVMAIFFSKILSIILEGKKYQIYKIIQLLFAILLYLFISFSIAGYFIIDINHSSTEGFGNYSMNLLAPIISLGHSVFLKSYPFATPGQYEGFNYFGFGLLLLMLVACYELLKKDHYYCKTTHLPLIIMAILLTLIAISNKITFADKVLYEFKLPGYIDHLLGVVRSSGRLFWPVTYLLTLTAIAVIIKYNRIKHSLLIILCLVGIQILDFLPGFSKINYDDRSWHSPLQSEQWHILLNELNHIAFIPPLIKKDDYVPFALLAAQHQKTLNVGYTARVNHQARQHYIEKLTQTFESNQLKTDTLYVIRNNHWHIPKRFPNHVKHQLDNYSIIIPLCKPPASCSSN